MRDAPRQRPSPGGALRTGWFADVVVFDPAKTQDHATFDQPHHYATGFSDVIVNGVPVIADGGECSALAYPPRDHPIRFARGTSRWQRAAAARNCHANPAALHRG